MTQQNLPSNSGSTSSNVPTLVSASTVNQLLIEPLIPADNGEFIAQAIRNAKQFVWLEVYLLTQSNVIAALIQAAQSLQSATNLPATTDAPATVDQSKVRVILEPRAYSTAAGHSFQDIEQQLTNAGVAVQKNATQLGYGGETHAKFMIVDGQVAYIMSANLTTYSIGYADAQGMQPASNREYIVIDSDPQRISTLMTLFTADWDTNAPRFDPTLLQSSALVVSPSFAGGKNNVVGNALAVLQQLIQSAQRTIQIEMEEIHENEAYRIIEKALVDAVTANVVVQLILPADPTNGKATTQVDISYLINGGVQVQLITTPIMHAKLILVDANVQNGQVVGGLAFVGSQNLSTNGMENNREVGLVISDANALYMLWQTFNQDWNNSQIPPQQ